MYEFFNRNNVFSNNHSVFRPNDSRIHQLIAIARNMISSFDANPSLEVRGVFPDLSKAFDRVWHDCLFKNSRVMELAVTSLNLLNCF